MEALQKYVLLKFKTVVPYAIEKVDYKTATTYKMMPLEEFYGTLTMNKKLAIFSDLKQTFTNREDALEKLLEGNIRMAEFISKIQKDVLKEFRDDHQVKNK